MALLPPLPRKFKGRLALGAAAIVALGALAIYGEHGLLHLLRLQEEQRSLEQTAFQLQQHNEQLRQHISKLQNDDAYLERLTRERFGLVRPDELVYRTKSSSTSPRAR